MADNPSLVALTALTAGALPTDVTPALVELAFSGQTVHAPFTPLGLAEGAEGARTGTLVGPTNPLPVIPRADTATVTSVPDTDSSGTLAAANTSRKGLVVYNKSTEVLYLKYGSGASASSFTDIVAPDQKHVMGPTIYTGIVTGVWSANASGVALVTELT